MSKDEEIKKLRAALKLAKDMMVANDLNLPNTFEIIDEAIFYPYPKHKHYGDDCWCNPEITEVEGGSNVIIHNDLN